MGDRDCGYGTDRNVVKVNMPRNDLQVEVAGYAVPTRFGFGGWFAMTKGLHDWGRGPADKLAAVFKAAVDELGKGNKQ